jgi:predicted AlkP superfamily pyrophosphatase or phosphodiesterase
MRYLRLVVFVALAFSSCVTAPATRRGVLSFAVERAEDASQSRPVVESVVIVTLDGARWQDIFQGPEELMPTLHRWMTTDGAGLGAPGHGEVWASGPNYVSMPGYREILTGRPSPCHSNACGPITMPTLVDEVITDGKDAAVLSSWELIERVAAREPSRATLSAGRHVTGRVDELDESILAEGRSADAWPGIDDYRPDALTSRLALGLLDRHLPRLLFVGLGDTDEHAHHGDYPRYLEALRQADRFLADLEKRVTEHTVVFVTADHGRSVGFRDHGGAFSESGRVWMVVKGSNARGLVDSPTLHLADIAPTIRCMLGMRTDTSGDAGHPIAPLCAD